MGYKCVPRVMILYYIFLDTFIHLFNVETGTINSAINSNLYAFDGELNSTPFHIAQIFKLGFVCATIELLISFVSKTSVQLKVLFLILLFKLVIIILTQLVRSSRLLLSN